MIEVRQICLLLLDLQGFGQDCQWLPSEKMLQEWLYYLLIYLLN